MTRGRLSPPFFSPYLEIQVFLSEELAILDAAHKEALRMAVTKAMIEKSLSAAKVRLERQEMAVGSTKEHIQVLEKMLAEAK